MRTIVVYPGRFHPFHRGHKASYDHLVKQFGADNVYIVSSNKQAPLTSPFSFDDKMTMMTKLGVPPGKIAQVKNPYQPQEITSEIDDRENTVLIFAVSEKDMTGPDARFKFGTKKDGTASYIQPYPANGKKLQNMTKHAYVMVTPTVNFQVRGADANSASEIRKRYIEGNDADREQIIADLYGDVDTEIKMMFDRNLGVGQQIKNIVKEARVKNPARAVQILETIRRLERAAHGQDTEQLDEFLPALGAAVGSEIEDALDDENADYIEEKWSQKYKRSINCNNPKGFSQRAHCAGRKK